MTSNPDLDAKIFTYSFPMKWSLIGKFSLKECRFLANMIDACQGIINMFDFVFFGNMQPSIRKRYI